MLKEIVNHNKIKFLANLWMVVLTIFVGAKIAHGAFGWQGVGNSNFSGSVAQFISIDLDSKDVPYVAFQDWANSAKATVMKYDSSSSKWVNVGSAGFSAGKIDNTSFVIDSSDVPHVAYVDYANNHMATVMKYDGSGWVSVGNTGFSPGRVSYTSLAIDSNNVPYVAFQDWANSAKATVMKYDSSSSKWVNVGSAGFSSSSVTQTSLATDSSGVPYIAFEDGANNRKATVMKYDSSSSKWVSVGSAGFSPGGQVLDLSFAIDGNDVPYVAFREEPFSATSYKITVMKYDGSKWIMVGGGSFSNGGAQDISLKIDSNNVPYVVFQDIAAGTKATVMKYDSSSSKWVSVGSAGFSNDSVYFVDIALDSHDKVYVAFRDNSTYGINVMNYLVASSKKEITKLTIGINVANIDQTSNNITIEVSCRTDITKLAPVLAISDKATVNPRSGNSLDFTNPQKYTVTAEDGSTRVYTATVNVLPCSWKPAGNNGSTTGNNEIVSIVSDFNNTKYVAFGDNDENDKATVIKYDGLNSWSRVGRAGFTPDRADWVSLAANTYGTPYVAYSDYSRKDANNVGKASVMRYLGGTAGWVNIGNAGFSSYGAEYTRLALDKKDVPYVAFIDNNPKLNSPITVMKYEGSISKWVPVGVPGFSNGTAWYPYITFDNLNTPYVSYRDQATGKAVVMKFDGRRWVNVGPVGFTTSSVDNPQIKFDSNNNLYISFQDWSQGGKVTVMKYDGIAAWTAIGTPGFSKEESYGTSLFIYKNELYVSFSYIAAYSGKIEDGVTVMKYDSSRKTWNEVGTNPISVPASYTNMLVDQLGVPYVVAPGDPLVVMKFD
ncbi:MAG: hypothetical protein KBB86_02090 [Candidatus Pacebacteria bacterium]|nr:hypothetical protein [Candidatus Paceibacterota bacterium]